MVGHHHLRRLQVRVWARVQVEGGMFPVRGEVVLVGHPMLAVVRPGGGTVSDLELLL